MDFHQLLSELSEEVGVMNKDLLSEVDRRVLADYGITASAAATPTASE